MSKSQTLKDILFLTLATFLTTALFFGYVYLTKGKLENVYKAWDGPSYVIAALSEYVPARAVTTNTIRSVDIREDFTFLPAHFPLYPTLIRSLSFLDPYKAMLGLSVLSHLGFVLSLYFLGRTLKFTHAARWAALALVLPPRYFIVSHTGSSEPLFLLFLTLSLAFFARRHSPASAIFASLALATRPQGALLGVGYAVVALISLIKTRDLIAVIKRFWPYLLMPITLIFIFVYYQQQTGDFWAFFRAISIFHHFSPTLFPTFHFGAPNIETFWHEVNVIYYLLYAYVITRLFARTDKTYAILALCYYLPLLFLQHTDISRYSLSLLPFMFVAFHSLFSRRDFFLTALLLLPAVILYSSDFIQYNRAP